MIRLGQVGTGALTLPFLLQQEQLAAANRQRPHLVPTNGRAKSCILIYLWGGPPQMDMWDPNPEAPVGIRSLFQPIDTVVPGIRIAEEMPLFARHTDKTTIIRSYSHDSNNHEPSVFRSLTGKIDRSLRVPRNNRTRKFFPNVQGVVSAFTPMGAPSSSRGWGEIRI